MVKRTNPGIPIAAYLHTHKECNNSIQRAKLFERLANALGVDDFRRNFVPHRGIATPPGNPFSNSSVVQLKAAIAPEKRRDSRGEHLTPMAEAMSISSPGYFDRKPSSSVRPGLAHLQGDPSSPHTPQRTISSAVSSPSASYRTEEEPLVFEFGARHFSAGYAGESYPRCTLAFGPEASRRTGDYRKWLPGYDERSRKNKCIDTWGDDYELWRMDVRGLDIGLVEDKIERAVREAYSKYLLLDYKSTKKLILVLPSVMPYQLLNTVLSTLFQNSPSPPSITLLPPPALATAAAGCRSSLMVDIGWRETVITAVYEYREVQQSRTTRAMRLVTLEMAKILERRDHLAAADTAQAEAGAPRGKVAIDLEQAEEITSRLAWCKSLREVKGNGVPAEDTAISIPSPSSPRRGLQVPLSVLAGPVEDTFLSEANARELDDDEQPLHLLVYKSLLSLPADVRTLCMSRIIFTGGGSNIPGLKTRLLDEVAAIVEDRGWDKAYGRAAAARRKRLREKREQLAAIEQNEASLEGATNSLGTHDTTMAKPPTAKVPPHLDPRLPDATEEEIRQRYPRDLKPVVSGVVRGVETLGAWAGASLLATLRMKGIVEIEKETFVQYGLSGARKDAAEVSAASQKGFGPVASKAGERPGWKLGAWA